MNAAAHPASKNLEALRTFFENRPEVAAACLFGSAVTGRSGPLSDLDVAVLLATRERATSSLAYEASLLSDLMRVLRANEVDLVILNNASPMLAHRVIRDGDFFHVRDSSALTSFRFQTLQRYLDSLPIRAAQAEALTRRIEAGRFARTSG